MAVDYDLESEDAAAEAEGEDLRSEKSNSEDGEDSENSESRWIVEDAGEEQNKAADSFYEIMEIRKSYNKPIIVDFKGSSVQEVRLRNSLTVRLVDSSLCFPLSVVEEKKIEQETLPDIIKTFIKQICSVCHGSKENKDDLIGKLHLKYDMLPKAALNKFFKKYLSKEKCEETSKVWV